MRLSFCWVGPDSYPEAVAPVWPFGMLPGVGEIVVFRLRDTRVGRDFEVRVRVESRIFFSTTRTGHPGDPDLRRIEVRCTEVSREEAPVKTAWETT